jgi:hypothetical protein
MRDYASVLPICLDFDLYTSGWNGFCKPYPGMTPKQKAMQSLRSSLLKKFADKKLETADSNALALFLKVNEKCQSYSLDTSRMTEIHAIALGEAKDFLYRFFYYDDQSQGNLRPLSLSTISRQLGVGNGANIGAFSTDFLSKVGTSTMTATDPKLFMLYKQAISVDPLWSSVESTRSKFRANEIVRGSRLSFVPKTTEISRTICTEPLLNMLFQKGIAAILEQRLVEICGIDLSRQPDKNRRLAQLGSENGKFGTIDLSSASDSMSINLVRSMFPEHVFDLLMLCRSPVATLPGGVDVQLHMVSSMGNAFTFPLQTIFFSAIVYGVYRALGIPINRPFRHSLGNFAVFGDDIIVVSEAYGLVCDMLSLSGFSVNVDKSFNTGPFRESCGEDYYLGHNVRGVYIKTLRTSQDCYSAINRLNRWSAKWDVPLPGLISTLLKGNRLLPVPFDEQDDSGIKVPLSMLKQIRVNKYTGGVKYRYLYKLPVSYSVTDVELKPPKLRGWVNNPDAVFLAALAGSLRAGRVTIRSSERSAPRLRTRYSSRWDYIPSEHAVMRAVGERWKSLVELNLTFFKV